MFRAIHTPGHTTDHLCFWLEEEKALFSGDTILGQGTTEFEDLFDYMNSLKTILNLSPKRIYPGHGPVVENPRETIEHYLSHRQQRNEQILSALNESQSELKPEEIARRVYKDLDESLFPAACHNVRNHLEVLKKQNLVGKFNDHNNKTFCSCVFFCPSVENVETKKWALRLNSSI